MQLRALFLGTLFQSLVVRAVALPDAVAIPLQKRDQKTFEGAIWFSTNGAETLKITPTIMDGVTISASPVTNSATPWVSLDATGIPYLVTPTVSGGSTISASPTPSDTNYPAPADVPPVLRCFGDRVPSEDNSNSPFCSAQNGSELLVGESYWITWDPTYWGGSDVTRIILKMRSYPVTDDDTPLFTSNHIHNANGYFRLLVVSNMKKGDGYFFMNITPVTSPNSDAVHVGTKAGPLLRVISSRGEATNAITRVPSDNAILSSRTSGTKVSTIVPAVVVPVVVGVALVAAIFWYLKKKRGAFPSVTRSRFNHTEDSVNLDSSSLPDNATLHTQVTGEDANPFKDPVVRTEIRSQL